MQRLVVLFALAVATALGSGWSYNSSMASEMCFDTMLVSSSRSVIAIQDQRLMCPLWSFNKRHVYASQSNDAQTQIAMLVTYVGSAHLPAMLETYSLSTGMLISSVELRQALLPPLLQSESSSSDAVAFCVTLSDVFLWYSGSLQHFDRATGAQKPLSPLSYNGKIKQSDRLWMTCSDLSIYVSVPAANAVWQLDPSDGLLLSVVALVQSPTALSLDRGLLRVASGRPAIRILSYDLVSGINRGSLPLAGAAGKPSGLLRGIAFTSAASPELVVTLDDQTSEIRLYTQPQTAVVFTMPMLAIRQAQTLLAGGRSAVSLGGLPLSLGSGQPIVEDVDSALLNAGNADELSASLYTADQDRNLVLLDKLGTVLEFSSFDHRCPVMLKRVLPPLAASDAQILHVDESDPNTPLLYTIDEARVVVMRPSIRDGQELVWPQFCAAGDLLDRGLSTTRGQGGPRACGLCGKFLRCTHLRVQLELPAHIATNLNLVRLAWGVDYEFQDQSQQASTVMLFYGNREIWSLDLWQADQMSPEWTLVQAFASSGTTSVDPAYWDVQQSSRDWYAVRTTADMLYMWSPAANISSIPRHSVITVDHAFLIGTTVVWVPNLDFADVFESDSLCVGFGTNESGHPGPSQPPKRRDLTKSQVALYKMSFVAGIVLMLVGSLLCVSFTVFTVLYRTSYPCFGWLSVFTGGRAPGRGARSWSKLAEANGSAGVVGGGAASAGLVGRFSIREYLCGVEAQAMCFNMCSCVPWLAGPITSTQEWIVRPFGKSGSGRSGYNGHEQALYTSAPSAVDDASDVPPPLSATDNLANTDLVRKPFEEVNLTPRQPDSPTTPPPAAHPLDDGDDLSTSTSTSVVVVGINPDALLDEESPSAAAASVSSSQ